MATGFPASSWRRRDVSAAARLGLAICMAGPAMLTAEEPCAAPAIVAADASASAPTITAGERLASRIALRTATSCSRPFVIDLDLELRSADGSTTAARRSAPREFRPGERFLPGDSYLLARVFPESAVLLDALFDEVACGAVRVLAATPLEASAKEPESHPARASCRLVVGFAQSGEPATGSARPRLLLELGPEP